MLLFLLKLFYFTSKLSGFSFITINFTGAPRCIKSHWNFMFFLVSLALSVYANFHSAYYPVGEIVQSEILEIGVNFVNKRLLVVFCVVKIVNFFQKSTFFSILSNIYKVDAKVKHVKVH
jgi:hypothetical protein